MGHFSTKKVTFWKFHRFSTHPKENVFSQKFSPSISVEDMLQRGLGRTMGSSSRPWSFSRSSPMTRKTWHPTASSETIHRQKTNDSPSSFCSELFQNRSKSFNISVGIFFVMNWLTHLQRTNQLERHHQHLLLPPPMKPSPKNYNHQQNQQAQTSSRCFF